MPRPPRIVIPGLPHHVTQRGNYRQTTFFCPEDYKLYLDLLEDYSRAGGITVQAYCLMPNHVHLIVTPVHAEALARTMRRLHSDYARLIHTKLRRVGHLWQARYHSGVLDQKHFWYAMAYVEQNPVRASLVARCEEWPWSSARARLTGECDRIVDLRAWMSRYSAGTWRRVLDLGLTDATLLERIREATLRGKPIGGPGFADDVQQEFRIRIPLDRPGRPQLRKGTEVTDTQEGAAEKGTEVTDTQGVATAGRRG